MENKMALVDFAPASRPSVADIATGAFRAVANWVATQRAESARRLALRDLLEMESHRLNDLGINAFDVQQALRRGPSSRG
jgi:uncharacterized protein YjiS (DUF1127 family)